MAFASIISSAIGIILLIITAYVLVAGVLTATQVAMNAQSDMTAVHVVMLGTSMDIDSVTVENSTPYSIVYLNVRNSGSEPIDLSTINVFMKQQNSAPVLYPKGSIAGTWSILPDTKQWRPTETLNMSVRYSGTYPVIVQLTTGNGISAVTKVEAP
jgi:archaeal flagellar protein FlaF